MRREGEGGGREGEGGERQKERERARQKERERVGDRSRKNLHLISKDTLTTMWSKLLYLMPSCLENIPSVPSAHTQTCTFYSHTAMLIREYTCTIYMYMYIHKSMTFKANLCESND